MKTFNIMLNSIVDVKDFVNIVNKYSCEIDLTSSRYIVDAKSIMGIFSLDLSKPIKVDVHCNESEEIFKELAKYEVK
ncbi:MAG: HPr family phosphocarrier protein [Bacillota bacterium]|nr:HPr family phosphocarrier protein [Bacillota bacterium]